jgi:hypothetical protein
MTADAHPRWHNVLAQTTACPVLKARAECRPTNGTSWRGPAEQIRGSSDQDPEPARTAPLRRRISAGHMPGCWLA